MKEFLLILLICLLVFVIYSSVEIAHILKNWIEWEKIQLNDRIKCITKEEGNTISIFEVQKIEKNKIYLEWFGSVTKSEYIFGKTYLRFELEK